MKAYRLIAAKLRPLENYSAPTYNSEPRVSRAGVQWSAAEGKCVKVEEPED